MNREVHVRIFGTWPCFSQRSTLITVYGETAELLHTGQVLLWFDQIVCAAARRLRGLSSKSMEDVERCSSTLSAISICCRMAASTLHFSMVLIVPPE
jgi:hypothetical protein